MKPEKQAGEPLEFFGPPLPPDYDPPGLWDEWDAVGQEAPHGIAKCEQLSLAFASGDR